MKSILSTGIYLFFSLTLLAQTEQTFIDRADSLFELGEYETSKTAYENVVIKKQSKISPQYLYCQTQIVECDIRLNNLEEAQSLVTNCLTFCPDNLISERALLENSQAKILYQKGQLEQASNQIQHAIQILQRSSMNQGLALAECYNTQGLIDWIAGNDEKSLEYFNQSLELRKKIFGEKSHQVAGVYNNLGLVFSGFDLDQSLGYYGKALVIYEKIYPRNHPALAIEYSNLGQIYRKQKVYNTSLVQYEKALAIWNERYVDAHPNKAFVYSSIAQVVQDKKEYIAALEYANKALAIYKTAYGEAHPNTAACYTLIAGIYSDQGDYNNALIVIQKSLISNCSSFSKSDYTANPIIKEYFDGKLLLSSLTLKGVVLSKRESEKTLRLKDLSLALSTYQSCDTLLDKLRQTRTSKNDKVALGIYSYDVYDKSIELCLLLAQNTFRKEFYLTKAYYFVERSKASVLQESIAESKAKMFAGIPSAEIEQEDTYKATITYLEQMLAKGITDELLMKNVAAQLFEVKRKYESFIHSLEINYPAYYNLKYNVQPIQLVVLQALLKPTDCIVEYFISEQTNTIQIFRITQKDYKVYSVPLMSTYDKYISGMRNAIKFNNKSLFIKTASTLYDQLIPSLPSSCTHLIIIPDGKMGAIPFEALLKSKPKTDTVEYAQLDFLIKKFTVSYTYAGSLYAKAGKKKSDQSILLFAPVNFNSSSDIPSLPGTLVEVDSLKELFNGNGTPMVYTYEAASKNILINDSISQYSIIHLATHGLVDEEQPELSCIYTYGTTEENDRIYSGDLYNIHLNANLVTLSA